MALPPNEDTPRHGRRDSAIALAIGALVLGAVLVGQFAPRDATAPAASAKAPAKDLACAEWSNGCRICIRRGEGPACSLPGIACTPGVSACTRRSDP